MQDLLERNLNHVRGEVAKACEEAGRDPDEITLVAVTKRVSIDAAVALFELGVEDFGESRAEGLEAKRGAFEERGLEARWHFVGHLQRNKAGKVVRASHTIHSVDSVALLDALDRHAEPTGRPIEVFLQVLLSDEESKHGFDQGQLVAAVDRAAEMDHVDLLGLMTMAPWIDAEAERRTAAREVFDRLAALAEEVPALGFVGGQPRLSMGMSGDLREAILAGSDVVRIGSALFRDLPENERAG